MQWAINEGRTTRPNLEVGICGEHGGDPNSVEWCHIIGNNYVSCSPFRVPIARLAAAHAALTHRPKAVVKKSAAKKPAVKKVVKKAVKKVVKKK
jgi:pyruvate,orthophosphate dikinase